MRGLKAGNTFFLDPTAQKGKDRNILKHTYMRMTKCTRCGKELIESDSVVETNV